MAVSDERLHSADLRPVEPAGRAGAGHYIGVYQPYTSATEAALTRTGGTLAGTQAANLDLHSKILTLLASL